MLNVLTVDVEDYFHVEAFAPQIPCEQWHSYAPRVERNVSRILETFDTYHVKGTFFVLGWVADRFPAVVRAIAAEGHEIGCHGYAHRRLHQQTPEQFRDDIKHARISLADQVQREIKSYRAPSFSIVKNTMWALEVLWEEGFLFDSSIFPVWHDHYGIPDADRFPHWVVSQRPTDMFEFPPSTLRLRNMNCGVAGGGYLRLLPYALTHWAIRHLNEFEKQPAMIYFHPWEIDLGQPPIKASVRSTLRHYLNLSTMEEKIQRLLEDFKFTTLADASRQHDAFRAPLDKVSQPVQIEAARIARAAVGGHK